MVSNLTSEQVRAARAMLRLDEQQFANLLHVSLETMLQMERSYGPLQGSDEIVQVVRASLTDAGIQLIDPGSYVGIGGPGVRMIGEPVTTAEIIDIEISQAAKPPEPKAVPA
jgi:DNA-binding XRE family transcriptional regulator